MSEREKFEEWMNDSVGDAISVRDVIASYKPLEVAQISFHEGYRAALSTRKVYGFGIVDKDGRIERSLLLPDRNNAKAMTDLLNSTEYPNYYCSAPYRFVELFYEDSDS